MYFPFNNMFLNPNFRDLIRTDKGPLKWTRVWYFIWHLFSRIY
jgi:hypothetical protein